MALKSLRARCALGWQKFKGWMLKVNQSTAKFCNLLGQTVDEQRNQSLGSQPLGQD